MDALAPEPSEIDRAIVSAIADARVEITDLGGGRFDVLVEAPEFSGNAPAQCHRAVYRALGALVDRGVRALVVRTRPPADFV